MTKQIIFMHHGIKIGKMYFPFKKRYNNILKDCLSNDYNGWYVIPQLPQFAFKNLKLIHKNGKKVILSYEECNLTNRINFNF